MEHSSPSTSQLGLGIALAVGLIVSTWTFMYIKTNANNTITVKGYAEKSVKAEQGVWKGTVQLKSNNVSEGYKELTESVKAVKDFITELGFDKDQIETENAQHYAVFKKTPDGQNFTNEVDYYTFSQRVVVKSPKVEEIQQLAGQVSKLNEGGCDLVSEPVAYYYPSDKLELVKLQMIAEATQNAYQRAVQFATHSGNRVGKLLNAHQGLFQVVAPYSATSDYDRYDTSSIDKIVKLVVTLTYNVA